MLRPQFKNMNELNAYLEALENRVIRLEQEEKQLKGSINAVSSAAYQANNQIQRVPQTGMQSPSFLKRAFSVWGHYFVAQLIIGLVAGCLYFVIVVGIIGMLVPSLR
jgi:hypothetical protein